MTSTAAPHACTHAQTPGRQTKTTGPLAWLLLIALVVVGWCAPSAADAEILSQAQVAQAFANSSNPYLAANSATFAAMSHNVENTTGNTTTYNGSCCTGLMQINQGNLKNPSICGCTRDEYAAMSGQQQIDVYTKYYNTIQNDAGIKQLQQMQANGESLGGQKVDGAMIASCAQLGTGNCRAAIANNCSSLANGSGGDGHVNICTMAARADGGTQVDNATANQTPNADGTPAGTSTGTGSGQALQDKNVADCWICDAATRVIDFDDTIGTNLTDTIATNALGLMAGIFALVVTCMIIKSFFVVTPRPGEIFPKLWWMTARFVVVMTLLSTAGLYTNFIKPFVLVPTMEIGGNLGQTMNGLATTAFKTSALQSGCNYDQSKSSDADLKSSTDSVLKVLCGVHMAFNTAIKAVTMPASQVKAADSSTKSDLVASVLSVAAIMSAISLWTALLTFGFQVVEALLRIGVYTALAPFLLYLWVYKQTSKIFYSMFREMAYAGTLVAVSGIMSSIMILILGLATQKIGTVTTFSSATDSIGKTVLYIVYVSAAGAMAAGVMRSASSVALAIVGASQAAAQAAAGGAGAVMKGIETTAAVGTWGAYGMGRMAGVGANMGLTRLSPGMRQLGGLGALAGTAGSLYAMTQGGKSSTDIVEGQSLSGSQNE